MSNPIAAASALLDAINAANVAHERVVEARSRLLVAEQVVRELGNDAQAVAKYEDALARGVDVAMAPPVDDSVARSRVNGCRRALEQAQVEVTRQAGRVSAARVAVARELQRDAVERYQESARRLVADFADLLELTDRVGMPLFAAPARILIPAAEGMPNPAGPGLFVNWDTIQTSGVGLAAKARIDAEMQRLLGLVESSQAKLVA